MHCPRALGLPPLLGIARCGLELASRLQLQQPVVHICLLCLQCKLAMPVSVHL